MGLCNENLRNRWLVFVVNGSLEGSAGFFAAKMILTILQQRSSVAVVSQEGRRYRLLELKLLIGIPINYSLKPNKGLRVSWQKARKLWGLRLRRQKAELVGQFNIG